MRFKLILLIGLLLFAGCEKKKESAQNSKELLVYCGITMVAPMREIADLFEKDNPGVKVTMVQGGSQDLYNSLKMSKKGDLYLPGSVSYRTKNLKDGLFGDSTFLGYNQAAIVVKKGNPKKISGKLEDLITTKNSVVLCNPKSGSIGRMTKKILSKGENTDKIWDNTAFLTTDSRNMTKALKDGQADVVINWKATAFWPENRDDVEMIALPDSIAPKKELVLNILTFTKNPKLAKKFLRFAGSKKGLTIFESNGF